MRVGYGDVICAGTELRIRTDPTKLQTRGVDNFLYGSVSRLAEVVRHVFELVAEALDGVEIGVPDRLPSWAIPQNVKRVTSHSLTLSAWT